MGMGPTVLTLGTLLLRISSSKEAFSVTRLAEEEEVTLGVRFHRKSLVLTAVMCRYKRAARDRRKEVVGWSKGFQNQINWLLKNLTKSESSQLSLDVICLWSAWTECSWMRWHQSNSIISKNGSLFFVLEKSDPWYPRMVTKVGNTAIISNKGSLFIVLEKHCQRHNGPINWLRDLD